MLGGTNSKHKHSRGYTIIEVIIVLAISGMMFAIAANFINGKQEHTAFQEGTNDMVNQLQRVVSDVTDGHYSDIPLTCVAGGSSLTISQTGAASQGSNQSCVFLGKLVNFYNLNGSLTNAYQTISIVASRSLNGSLPQNAVSGAPGLTTSTTIPQGLYITSMSVRDSAGAHGAYSIGFTQSLGDQQDGVYKSNAQDVGLIYDSNLTAPSTNKIVSGNEDNIPGSSIKPATSAALCITDGTRSAWIYIGGSSASNPADNNNGNQLSITAQQLGKVPTCS